MPTSREGPLKARSSWPILYRSWLLLSVQREGWETLCPCLPGPALFPERDRAGLWKGTKTVSPYIHTPDRCLPCVSVVGIQRAAAPAADPVSRNPTCFTPLWPHAFAPQTVAFLASLYHEFCELPHLVVVPLSTMRNWEREFATWAPQLNVVSLAGNAEARAVRAQAFYR